MQHRRPIAILVPALAAAAGLALATPGCDGARPEALRPAPERRSSLHAAPAGDTADLNADVERRLPEELATTVLADGLPGVVFFLKADCGCSKGFAATATALAPHLQGFAGCTAVIEGTAADAAAFAADSGLAIPTIAQPESDLARAWGITKAGCVALVAADGSVEAIWPGISRQGFRDLAGRLGVEPPLPEALLAGMAGAAMAGCPLDSRSNGPAAGAPITDRPDASDGTSP